jgi:integrase
MKKKQSRKHGYGTLEKRGNIYIARWMSEGKRYSRSTEKSDKDEAEKLLKEWTAPFRLENETEKLKVIEARISEKNHALTRALDAMPALTLADAWQEFVDAPKGTTARSRKINPSGRTLNDYFSKWSAFLKWTKENYPKTDKDGEERHIEMREITPEIAHAYIKYIGSKFSLNTRNKTITLLRLVFSVLETKARLSSNPFTNEVTTSAPAKRKRYLTTSELAELSRVLETSNDREMELLFAMGYYLGARRGDCALMQWASIDMDGRVIRYTPRKTEKHNSNAITVRISDELFNLLARIPKSKRKGYVLPGIADLYLKDAAKLSARIQKVFVDAGIETTIDATDTRSRRVSLVGFHSLRHTYITRLLSSGISMEVVRKQAGHSTISMTAHYAHETDETRAQIASAMPPMKAISGLADDLKSKIDTFLEIVDKLDVKQLTTVKRRLDSALATRKK